MKRNLKRSLCVLMVMLLTMSAATALAEDEKETVYVLADAQGQPRRVIVNGSDRDEALPFTVSFRYELDGQEIAPADLAGKSGRLVIRIDYASALTGMAEVKGEQVEMPIPLLAATVLPLDRDVYANVEVTNGKVIDIGRISAAVCFGLPGLGEAMNAGGYEDLKGTFTLPASAEISADVTNFRSEGAYTVVTGIPAGMADAGLPFSLDLDSVSGQLKDAMAQLTSGADQLADGTGKLQAGASKLALGTVMLAAGADALNTGASSLSEGLQALNENSAALAAGADQMTAAILETVNGTLSASADAFAAAGVEMIPLTLENYNEEIDRLETALLTAAQTGDSARTDAASSEEAAKDVHQAGTQSEAYEKLETLRAQLAGVQAFRDGLAQYTAGVDQAAQGAKKVADGAGQVDSGVKTVNSGMGELAAGAVQLNAGMGQLKTGLTAFDQQAVQKLTGYLDGDVREILDRAKAVLSLHYDGYLNDSAAATLFIIRTEGI